jgi:NAD+ kinase
VIVHDERNPIAVSHARALLDRGVDPSFGGSDLVVVIGGDGFLLHTIAEQGLERTYLGLNAGRVGFLLNDVGDWDVVAAQITGALWSVHPFPVLEAKCWGVNGEIRYARAVNDVYLERASGQTARLHVSVDGTPIVETLVADGLIVATALGSTAYSFSAGGPACHPALRMLNITPICPHLPRLSPFALPESCKISLQVQAPDRRPVRAVADGRDVDKVERVEVHVGASVLRLGWLPGHDVTSRMVRKILHP